MFWYVMQCKPSENAEFLSEEVHAFMLTMTGNKMRKSFLIYGSTLENGVHLPWSFCHHIVPRSFARLSFSFSTNFQLRYWKFGTIKSWMSFRERDIFTRYIYNLYIYIYISKKTLNRIMYIFYLQVWIQMWKISKNWETK